MATPEDIGANAEYIRMADEFVEVPGGANNNNYANVSLIVEVAEAKGVDAVWAGWGHASENPALPNALAKREITFIGPPAGPMHALGDKIGSTIIAQSADVRTIAWNGDGIKVDYAANGLPDDVYDSANVRSVEQAQTVCARVGFPVMIKASEGGGGKGIRRAEKPEELPSRFRQVQAEVPGSPIFIMRLATRARHLEVQLLADEHGGAIALHGRDCSVQRRHQKILEEGPPVCPSEKTWREMEAAAVRLAQAVGYVNAGTVEYLYTQEDDSFAFLELNPRLQVEHPVTEMITGVNLPAAQLCVAMGLPLAAIADVRRWYGEQGVECTPIDFANRRPRGPRGHVIAARITAENPDAGFQPTSGRIHELNFRSTPNVWGYFSVDSSGRVHEFADSQIGHIFAYGRSRERARRNLVQTLRDFTVRGEIRTTTEYLVDLIESEDFRENRIDTAWLDDRIAHNVRAAKPHATLVVAVGAVCKAFLECEERARQFQAFVERGQVPPKSLLDLSCSFDLIYDNVKYSLTTLRGGAHTFSCTCNDSTVTVDLRRLSDGGFLVLLSGRSHVAYAKDASTGLQLILDGATCHFSNEYDPTQLRATMAGKLARLVVPSGSRVAQGDAYAEVEVMKMYLPLTAPEGGTVRFVKPEGVVLEPGDLIATMELDDPSKVHRAETFTGKLRHAMPQPPKAAATPTPPSPVPAPAPASSPPTAAAGAARKPHFALRDALRALRHVLEGYTLPAAAVRESMAALDSALYHPMLPLFELEEQLSVLAGRVPFGLHDRLRADIDAYRECHASVLEAAAGWTGARGDGSSPAATPTAEGSDSETETAVSRAGAATAVPTSAAFATQAAAAAATHLPEFDLSSVRWAVEEVVAAAPEVDQPALRQAAAPLVQLATSYEGGVLGHAVRVASSLLRDYLRVEKRFAVPHRSAEDVIQQVRREGSDSEDVYALALSHANLRAKNRIILALLDRIVNAPVGGASGDGGEEEEEEGDGESEGKGMASTSSEVPALQPFVPILHELAALQGDPHGPVALTARALLVRYQQPSVRARHAGILSSLRAAVDAQGESGRREALLPLMDRPDYVSAHLLWAMRLGGHGVCAAAMEAYLRRVYRPYTILNTVVQAAGESPLDLASVTITFTGKSVDAVPVPGSSSSRADSSGVTAGSGHPIDSVDSFHDLATLHRAASSGSISEAFDTQSPRAQGALRTSPTLADRSSNGAPASAPGSPPTADRGGTGYPAVAPHEPRTGVLLFCESAAKLSDRFEQALELFPQASEERRVCPVNVLHVALGSASLEGLRPAASAKGGTPSAFESFLARFSTSLQEAGIRRVTFALPGEEASVGQGTAGRPRAAHGPYSLDECEFVSPLCIFTYRHRFQYREDLLVRHVEPPLAVHLELRRLRNFAIRLVPVDSRTIHVYSASPCAPGTDVARGAALEAGPRRFFVRAVVRQVDPQEGGPKASRSHARSRARSSGAGSREEGEMERVAAAADGGGGASSREYGVSAAADEEEDADEEEAAAAAAAAASSGEGDEEEEGRGAGSRLDDSPTTVDTRHLSGRGSGGGGGSSSSRRRHTDPRRALPGVDQVFVEALNALELALGSASAVAATSMSPAGRAGRPRSVADFNSNHIFLNVLPTARVAPEAAAAVLRVLYRRHERRLTRLAVSAVEVRVHARVGADMVPMRLVARDPTGLALRVDAYVEVQDTTSSRVMLASVSGGSDDPGPLDGNDVGAPYPVTEPFQRKRAYAEAATGTLYCYDFVDLIRFALRRQWKRHVRALRRAGQTGARVPGRVLEVRELVLGGGGGVEEVSRPPGENHIGMVAWRMRLFTPEYPEAVRGRELFIIANDITHKAGSFGVQEDELFHRVSVEARRRGVPRIYIAANSGARIGLAEEVKRCFRVAWVDERRPERGFEYLYLTPEDHERLAALGAVHAVRVEVGGETRYRLVDVVGAGSDLGVENLRGSGKIAGETSRAYRDTFTLTYVTGRSVGIGAYLVRLGQRTIQKATGAPILLTGYGALNKLMGREVYSSNLQIGGPAVMGPNGVSHLVVGDDLEGVSSILRWLAFVPRHRGDALPLLAAPATGPDPVDREVGFIPTAAPYDPRHLLCGVEPRDGSQRWIGGLLDRASFVEALPGWARTVVVGRGRLGGIPLGVVLSELRTVEKRRPADPAAPESEEQVTPQAGQVWFPDSAFKTAQAIQDMNGEELPLLVVANWRGFSGGQRDMFDEVLKFGSNIVDALVDYRQPVMVYIPPHGELRGGAWVVVDPTINASRMEMFAAPEGRGGVLEPSGVVSVKYRDADLLATARRLDPELRDMAATREAMLREGRAGVDVRALDARAADREAVLLSVYRQVAQSFADLHDTPGRMRAKGVIDGIVPWRHARRFFYWRLRRRLAETQLHRRMAREVTPTAGEAAEAERRAAEIAAQWAAEDGVATAPPPEASLEGKDYSDAETGQRAVDAAIAVDRGVIQWLWRARDRVRKRMDALREGATRSTVLAAGKRAPRAAVEGILALVDQLEPAEREQVVAALRRGVLFAKPQSGARSGADASGDGLGAGADAETIEQTLSYADDSIAV